MTDDHATPNAARRSEMTIDAGATAPARCDESTSTPERPPAHRSRRKALLTAGATAALGALAVGLIGQAEAAAPGPRFPGPISATSGTATPSVTGANTSTTGIGDGVFGQSQTGNGVEGTSTGGHGVYGKSFGAASVVGEIDNPSTNNNPAVFGTTSGGGAGVSGQTGSGTHAGVEGRNTGSGSGVFGESTGGAGVFGQTHSSSHGGVEGHSVTAGPGVLGQNFGAGPAVVAENLQGGRALQAIGHIASTGPGPTVEPSRGLGTSPPPPLVRLGATDTKGEITFLTSSNPSGGALVTLRFARPYGASPVVLISPTDTDTAKLGVYAIPTFDGFTVAAVNTPSALTSYSVAYFVIE